MCDERTDVLSDPEEDKMMDSSGATAYILIGREDTKTELARQMLSDAGLSYSFAYADISEGPLPQLLAGLNTFIGLEQISRLAARVRRNHRRC
jgi:hypothetical protein